MLRYLRAQTGGNKDKNNYSKFNSTHDKHMIQESCDYMYTWRHTFPFFKKNQQKLERNEYVAYKLSTMNWTGKVNVSKLLIKNYWKLNIDLSVALTYTLPGNNETT